MAALATTIKLGYAGPSVLLLRTALKAWGLQPAYPVANPNLFDGWVDGAVRSFQQQYGLTIDGIVGSETWAAMTGTNANPATSRGPDAQWADPRTVAADPTVTLSSEAGDSGSGAASPGPNPVSASGIATLAKLAAVGAAAYAAWKWWQSRKSQGAYGDGEFDGDDDERSKSAPFRPRPEDRDPKIAERLLNAKQEGPKQPKVKIGKRGKPLKAPKRPDPADTFERNVRVMVEEQLPTEIKRRQIDPEDDFAVETVRARVEKSVRIQLRADDVGDESACERTARDLERELARRKASVSVEATKVRDAMGKGAALQYQTEMNRRLDTEFARLGMKLPKGAETYKTTSVKHRQRGGGEMQRREGAVRTRVPEMRLPGSNTSSRNITAEEDREWLERVERTSIEPTHVGAAKNIPVDSGRYVNDQAYRLEMQAKAKQDANRRMEQTQFPTQTRLVSHTGAVMFSYKPPHAKLEKLIRTGTSIPYSGGTGFGDFDGAPRRRRRVKWYGDLLSQKLIIAVGEKARRSPRDTRSAQEYCKKVVRDLFRVRPLVTDEATAREFKRTAQNVQLHCASELAERDAMRGEIEQLIGGEVTAPLLRKSTAELERAGMHKLRVERKRKSVTANAKGGGKTRVELSVRAIKKAARPYVDAMGRKMTPRISEEEAENLIFLLKKERKLKREIEGAHRHGQRGPAEEPVRRKLKSRLYGKSVEIRPGEHAAAYARMIRRSGAREMEVLTELATGKRLIRSRKRDDRRGSVKQSRARPSGISTRQSGPKRGVTRAQVIKVFKSLKSLARQSLQMKPRGPSHAGEPARELPASERGYFKRGPTAREGGVMRSPSRRR